LFSHHNAATQTQEAPFEDRKIEVSIDDSEETEQVLLRYSTWTDGLGWCSQKTIRLDAEHLDDLQRALTVARHRIRRRRAQAGQATETAKVLQMPLLA
jgi:hypothetical protein